MFKKLFFNQPNLDMNKQNNNRNNANCTCNNNYSFTNFSWCISNNANRNKWNTITSAKSKRNKR